MIEWFAKYWWLLWALFVVVVIVVYRVRKRGGNEFLLRRIVFALFPHADPAGSYRREVTPVMITLIFGGLLVIALMLVVAKFLGS